MIFLRTVLPFLSKRPIARYLTEKVKITYPNLKWLNREPIINAKEILKPNVKIADEHVSTTDLRHSKVPITKQTINFKTIDRRSDVFRPNKVVFGEVGRGSILPLTGLLAKHRQIESLNDKSNNKHTANRFPTGLFRQDRFPRSSEEMELVFVGTASCSPTTSRGVSCTALRYCGDTFLFDCGESTQLKMHAAACPPGSITKIFITHLHGDHCFGLPGVICNLGSVHRDSQDDCPAGSDEGLPVVDIYGPEGIADYLRASLQLTHSRISVPYRVHELMNIPHLHIENGRFVPRRPKVHTSFLPHYGERKGGSQIFPNQDGTYDLCKDENLRVRAAPLRHTTPCVGFVVEERSRPGALRIERVQRHLDDNKEELRKLPHLRNQYMRAAADLKALGPDETYKFPDGTIVLGRDIIDPTIKGRKIVLLGDTCNSDMMVPIAMDADFLVHEATNAHLPMVGTNNRHDNYHSQEREAVKHGHSTPQMAGQFAKEIRAKKLVLTHFSTRYSGTDDDHSMKIMWKIEDQARSAVEELSGDNDVIAAWDTMVLGIPRPL